MASTAGASRSFTAIVFDLDDTLAPSKSPIDPTMAAALTSLLTRLPVAIISGGRFEQFQAQVLDRLTADESLLARLHLMPTCGTRYYLRRHGTWSMIYSQDLSASEKDRIRQALEDSARALGYWPEAPWGEVIEDRGSQVTFSALGQAAPLAAKTAWDPDGTRKRRLVERVAPLLPELEVRGGGSTSLDITRKGIDKAYGLHQLMDQLDAATGDLLFVGDRLDRSGNDYPALAAGFPCVPVTGWPDTLDVITRFQEWWDGSTDSPGFAIVSGAENAPPTRPAPGH
jgi:phosphomannomutase